MVDRVGAPPEIVRRQRQHADDAADPIVRTAMRKESAMAAVMLNHEEANQKARRRDGNEQRSPPMAAHEGKPCHDPECHQREKPHRQFGNPAPIAGLSITGETLPQLPRIDRADARIVPNAQMVVSERLRARARWGAPAAFFCSASSAAARLSAASFSSRSARSRIVFASTRAFAAA